MSQSRADIVATIGPASSSPEILRAMIEHHLDIARLNFSWGSHDEHAQKITSIRSIAAEFGKRIPILQDLSGPRIQTGATHGFNNEAIEVLTEKDLLDLDFGAAQKIDLVALSFVGCAKDVEKLREEMAKRDFKAPIIAKIERTLAITNIDEIIAAADGIMIARGDLGNEVPLEQIPFVQRDILMRASLAKKPVIVATQMMLSMTYQATPTRAEVTDVAHAILDGADGVMLSEESASGKFPVEAVTVMERIVLEAEKHADGREYHAPSSLVL